MLNDPKQILKKGEATPRPVGFEIPEHTSVAIQTSTLLRFHGLLKTYAYQWNPATKVGPNLVTKQADTDGSDRLLDKNRSWDGRRSGVVDAVGIEPTTCRLRVECSAS